MLDLNIFYFISYTLIRQDKLLQTVKFAERWTKIILEIPHFTMTVKKLKPPKFAAVQNLSPQPVQHQICLGQSSIIHHLLLL